jgi:hypothetical protein
MNLDIDFTCSWYWRRHRGVRIDTVLASPAATKRVAALRKSIRSRSKMLQRWSYRLNKDQQRCLATRLLMCMLSINHDPTTRWDAGEDGVKVEVNTLRMHRAAVVAIAVGVLALLTTGPFDRLLLGV